MATDILLEAASASAPREKPATGVDRRPIVAGRQAVLLQCRSWVEARNVAPR